MGWGAWQVAHTAASMSGWLAPAAEALVGGGVWGALSEALEGGRLDGAAAAVASGVRRYCAVLDRPRPAAATDVGVLSDLLVAQRETAELAGYHAQVSQTQTCPRPPSVRARDF